MRKISDESAYFVVSLKELMKYGGLFIRTARKNPEAKVLFPKKVKEVEMSAKEIAKGNS